MEQKSKPILNGNITPASINRAVRDVTELVREVSAIVAPITVSTPTLSGTWVDYGSGYAPAAYWKDSIGHVHLEGLVKSGAAGSVILTLPAGYRPSAAQLFPVVMINAGNPTLAYIAVGTDGTVTFNGTTTDWVTLSGITFRPAQ